MRKTKRHGTYISFYDWIHIQRHLEKMAARGWLLEKISNFGWRYRRGEPQQVQYAVTYFPESSDFNPTPPESQQTFEEFCAMAGWEHVASWCQMQIFRGPVGAPAIETDPHTQLDTIHRSMRKNFIPGSIAMAVLSALQLVLLFFSYRSDPVTALADNTTLVRLVLWLILLFITALDLTTYYLWLRRARKLAWTEGEMLPSRSHPILQRILLAFVIFMVILWLLSFSSMRMRLIVLLSFACMGVLLALVLLSRHLFKRFGVPARVSRVLVWVVSFAASFALIGTVLPRIIQNLDADWLEQRQAAATYEYDGRTWKIYADELPLYIEDFFHTDYPYYSRELETQSSPLLTIRRCQQTARMQDVEVPSLYYYIYDVHLPLIYDTVREDLLHAYDRRNRYQYDECYYRYEAVDPTPWGAREAWLLYKGEECQQRWLVCWEDHILVLQFIDGLTQAQIRTIADRIN